jgi:hypothetical protein
VVLKCSDSELLFELAVPALVILCSGIFVDAGEGVCSRITCSVGDSCACCGSYSGVSWGVSNDWAAACSSGDSCTTIVSPPASAGHVSPGEGILGESGGWPVHAPCLTRRAPNLEGQTPRLRLLLYILNKRTLQIIKEFYKILL